MADDARISIALPRHPKTVKLRRRLGADGCWALLCLFLWVAENRPEGDLTGMTEEDIEIAADWSGELGAFVKVLAEVGFLDGESDKYLIHDWREHNPWAAGRPQRIAAAKDAAKKKWGDKSAADKTRSRRLAEARAKGSHSADEWQALVAICGNRCVRKGCNGPLVKDHIVPIYQDGSDSIDNLQPLCKSCNSSKGADTTDYRPTDWKERLRNVSEMPAVLEKMPTPLTTYSPPTPHHKVKSKGAVAPFVLPDWVPKDVWKDYEEMRNKIHKPMTDRARKLAITGLSELMESGEDPRKVLEQSIFKSWQGLFPVEENHGQRRIDRGKEPYQTVQHKRWEANRAAVEQARGEDFDFDSAGQEARPGSRNPPALAGEVTKIPRA